MSYSEVRAHKTLALDAGTPAAASLDVSALPQLSALRMARCALRQMPTGVYACTGLCSLDLSSNKIMEVQLMPITLNRCFLSTIRFCRTADSVVFTEGRSLC